MKVFSDSHHQGLTQSLKMLFIGRLGYELRFPKGIEWYEQHLWNVYDHIDTAKQYLERETEGVLGITLDEFRATRFDILICSIPQHVPIFIKLRDQFQSQAKLIFQVGNAWSFEESFPIKNILASAKIPYLPNFNVVEYHQEFDLNTFYPTPIQNYRKVYSFINCLNTTELYERDWKLFLELERLLPDWEFRSFGGQCRDGWCNGPLETAEKMREATFIFQVKTDGDGYGHGIFSAAAVGRPIITRFSDYQGKLAEPLITSNSSIRVDNLSPETIAEMITLTNPDLSSLAIQERFKENVDFDAEERSIRQFLDRLL